LSDDDLKLTASDNISVNVPVYLYTLYLPFAVLMHKRVRMPVVNMRKTVTENAHLLNANLLSLLMFIMCNLFLTAAHSFQKTEDN